MIGYDGSTPILNPAGTTPVVMESPIPSGKTHFSLAEVTLNPPGNPTYSWSGGVLTVTHTASVWPGFGAQFLGQIYLVYAGYTTINIAFSTSRNLPGYLPYLSIDSDSGPMTSELSNVGPGNHTFPFRYYRELLYLNLWCYPAFDEENNYIAETVTITITFS